MDGSRGERSKRHERELRRLSNGQICAQRKRIEKNTHKLIAVFESAVCTAAICIRLHVAAPDGCDVRVGICIARLARRRREVGQFLRVAADGQVVRDERDERLDEVRVRCGP